jgi:hypothetical protein
MLVLHGDAKAFPTPPQPIFEVMLNFEHAEQRASERCPRDAAAGFAGFVTDFDIDADYVRSFEVQQVGGAVKHREIWVPAGKMKEFNAQLRSRIHSRAAIYGPAYVGPPTGPGALTNEHAATQLKTLSETLHFSVFDFASEVEANWQIVLANFGFWAASPPADQGLTREEIAVTLSAIARVWKQKFSDLPLPEGTLIRP